MLAHVFTEKRMCYIVRVHFYVQRKAWGNTDTQSITYRQKKYSNHLSVAKLLW